MKRVITLFIFIINIILHINEDTLANIIDKFNSQFSNKIESIPDNFWEGFFNSFNDSPVVDLKVIAEASPGVDLVVIKEKIQTIIKKYYAQNREIKIYLISSFNLVQVNLETAILRTLREAHCKYNSSLAIKLLLKIIEYLFKLKMEI